MMLAARPRPWPAQPVPTRPVPARPRPVPVPVAAGVARPAAAWGRVAARRRLSGARAPGAPAVGGLPRRGGVRPAALDGVLGVGAGRRGAPGHPDLDVPAAGRGAGDPYGELGPGLGCGGD